MPTDTVFVVTQCLHDYEGSTQFPIYVTHDEVVAESKVKEMNLRLAVFKANRDIVREHMKLWDAVNPTPRSSDYLKSPKKAQAKTNELYGKWIAVRYAELKKIIGTLPLNEQEDYHNLNEEFTWEIETVPYES